MLPPPKILLVTFGSLGDVYPFVAVGQALLKEGCRVVVATSLEHREIILSRGLEFAEIRPTGAEIRARLGLDRGAIARRIADDNLFHFEKIIFPHLAETAEQIDLLSKDCDVILSHPLAFFAQAVAEKRGLKLIVLTLSPAFFPSAYDPPKGQTSPFIAEPSGRFSLGYNRLALRIAASAAWTWAAPLRRFRSDLGLPSRGGFFFFTAADHLHFDTIALFSPLLTRTPVDPGGRALVAGHSFFDDQLAEDEMQRAELERFLGEGPAPIVFTLGSFVVEAGLDHYRAALAAARALKQRAVVLASQKDVVTLQQQSGQDVLVKSYLRHSVLFPKADAIVHHGGIGTLGQALKSGRPQLVTPYLGDQYDNAARLKRLGVARVLPGKQVTAAALTRELTALLAYPAFAERARAAAAAVVEEDGAAGAAKKIKEIALRQT